MYGMLGVQGWGDEGGGGEGSKGYMTYTLNLDTSPVPPNRAQPGCISIHLMNSGVTADNRHDLTTM